MISFIGATLSIRSFAGGKASAFVLPLSASGTFEGRGFDLDIACSSGRLLVRLRTKCSVKLEEVRLDLNRPVGEEEAVFCNGYQSWTDSREWGPRERMRSLSPLVAPLNGKYRFDRYGDYRFCPRDRGRGRFHAWSYLHYRRPDGKIELLGSLDERSAFTLFRPDCRSGSLRIVRDCAGLELGEGASFACFDLGSWEGEEAGCYDAWFAAQGIGAPARRRVAGWTSWYRHYQNISESIIQADLRAFRDAHPRIDVFQIDDGFQTAVGDWLSLDPVKFPRGLEPLVDEIHAAGLKAGLWLAPFAAQEDSALAREHPEWILRDASGRRVRGGSNWGGFWALDVEAPAFRDHMAGVFRTVLDDWGFDMVKLDFLYAACLEPRPGRTRGSLMAQAMDLARGWAGSKEILGCGVPLASAFGTVDACRVGCDVGLAWDEPRYMRLLHRERVSTARAILSALGRSRLDGRAFLADPDVFILREGTGLGREQRELLFFVNTLSGSLVFTSDDPSEYGDFGRDLLGRQRAWMDRELVSLRLLGERGFEALFREGGRLRRVAANLTGRPLSIEARLSGEGAPPARSFALGPWRYEVD